MMNRQNKHILLMAFVLSIAASNITANAQSYESCSVISSCPISSPLVSFGVFPRDKIIIIAQPEYPAAARAARITGEVRVEIIIGKRGRVVRASAQSAHPLLRRVALEAACQSRFRPIRLSGRAVNVTYTIVYNFQL